MRFLKAALSLALPICMAAVIAAPCVAHGAGKYKVYLSMSYSGNEWQTEAQNMVAAMAKANADKVELHMQIAGTDAQRQIQQINAMVADGANAIIVYPISPTALNPAIRHACAKHVVVFAYDSRVTEPCAYNVFTDQKKLATDSAQWVAKRMNYKGNLIFVTGVPGTSVDAERNEAAHAVFKKYPGIRIVAEPNGMWSVAVARKAIAEVMSMRNWSDIDGIWGSGACVAAWFMPKDAGMAADKAVPCGTEGTNGVRVAMLPPDAPVSRKPDYAPLGAPGISLESHPAAGAVALKLALKVLAGQSVPKDTLMPLVLVTSENVKLCKTGTWAEMRDGCNVFDPGVVTAGFSSNLYDPDTPELGLAAALKGEPEAK